MLDLEASYVWLKELIVSPDMIFHELIIASSPKFILKTLTGIRNG
jgi:hypothetical protein